MPSPLSIFSFDRQNPLAGLMQFLLAVLAIEGASALLPQNSLVQTYRTHALPKESPDWQVMGDSVAGGGIRVGQLAERLAPGTNIVNLSLEASGPEFPYFILKRQVAAGVLPKAIIYAPSPHTFGSKRVGLLVGAYATWPEIVEIALSGKEPFEVLYGVMCKLSYSLRHREQIAEVLKGRRVPQGFEAAKGLTVRDMSAENEPVFPIEKMHKMYRKGFELNEFNLYFFRKFLAEAQRRKIPVYWVSMPVLEVVKESRKPFDFEAVHQAFWAANQQQYGVKLLMPETPVYSPKSFVDYTHLSGTGAELFTETLSVELQKFTQGR